MTEYIILFVGSLIVLLNNVFDFLSKSFLVGLLVMMAGAFLHIIIKDAVKDAIKETKE